MEPLKCPFCKPYADDIVVKNDLCYARWERHPVNRGHILIIPFRHEPDFFHLTGDERRAILMLADECKVVIDANFGPAGYNIGFNVGGAAGQNTTHCYCHMIPRYHGDVKEIRGGIRSVVPKFGIF